MPYRRNFIRDAGLGMIGGLGLHYLKTDPPNSGLPDNAFTRGSRVISNDKIKLTYDTLNTDYGLVNIEINKDKYIRESNSKDSFISLFPSIEESDWMKDLTTEIQSSFRNSSDNAQKPNYSDLISFVQGNILYRRDWETTDSIDYSRHPVETIVDGEGDCVDKSLLTYGLLYHLGIDVGYVIVPNHIALIVNNSDVDTDKDPFFNISGQEYVYLETTEQVSIGSTDRTPEDAIYTYHSEHGYNLKNLGSMRDHISGGLIQVAEQI